MSLRKVSAVLVLLLALAPATLAAEQRINSVTVTGVTGDDLVKAEGVLHVRQGDIYSPKALQDDVLALLDLPFVMSARAKELTTTAGVDIVYEVESKGRLASISFTGNHKYKAKKLRKIGNIEKVEYYDLAQLSEARHLIVEKYKKDGYLFAKVDFASQPDGSVLFTIDEGPRLKVARIVIIGNTAFDDAVIKKKAVQTKTRKWLFFPFRLDENLLEEDRSRVQEFYRDAGYLDAGAKVELNLTANKKGIIIDFMVIEGPLYTVRSVSIAGNSVLTSEQLATGLKMTAGKPFSYTRTDVDIRAIKAAYGRIGYIDAQIAPQPVFAETGTEVDLTYRVVEGGPVAISGVEIYGNDKTRDNVIRRDLEFAPGETFNTDKLDESKKNLEKLSYFSKVEVAPDAKAPAGTPKRDAVVSVQEAPTGQFIIGAGINSNAGLIGQLAFIQRNYDYRAVPKGWRDIGDGRAWAGAGQSFEINAMPGTELSQFRIAYRDPRVNDSSYSFGANAHIWNQIFDSYTERRMGGELSVGRQFTKNAFWEATILADQVKIGSIEPGAPVDVTSVRGKHMVDTLGFTVGHDTRDSFVLPTLGHRVTGTVEDSSEIIGSDYNFVRLRGDGNWYKLVKKDNLDRPFVLSWRTRLGYITPTDGKDIPIFERYFAGGAYDVRGFAYRGLGPHSADDTALGGRLLTTGGLQYDAPLAAEVLRGVVFLDVGDLQPRASDFQLNDFRVSVGFGFRIIIPPPLNVPIAIDFGFPVVRKDEDETQLISFSIGRLL